MTAKKPDRFAQAAAQLWCLPQHSHKEMDSELAMSVAALLRREHAAYVRMVKQERSKFRFSDRFDVGVRTVVDNTLAAFARYKKGTR